MRTVVLVVDMQNDFIDRPEFTNRRAGLMNAVNRLTGHARLVGWPVLIWATAASAHELLPIIVPALADSSYPEPEAAWGQGVGRVRSWAGCCSSCPVLPLPKGGGSSIKAIVDFLTAFVYRD
jgi:hypothetical protein